MVQMYYLCLVETAVLLLTIGAGDEGGWKISNFM